MKCCSIPLTLLLLLSYGAAFAGGIYQEPDAFIKETFGTDNPEIKVLWPDDKLQTEIIGVLGHKYKSLRIRYWISDKKTAWILEEIGKEKPITTGIVINNNAIERIRILIFRESRGWEVRHNFFTQQFKQAKLVEDKQLSTTIDNISGATLSVRAVSKLARLALLLHQQVTKNVVP